MQQLHQQQCASIIYIYKTKCLKLSLTQFSNKNKNNHILSRSQRRMVYLYIGWSEVTVICSHTTISMLWGNMYCAKLSGEALSHYSNKKLNQLVFRKCPHYHYLTKNATSQ